MPKQKVSNTVEATLIERGKVHGPFVTHSHIAQAIKAAMRTSPQWTGLEDDVKECLESIAAKMARILNGGDAHSDSYHDIAGYAMLIEHRLTGTKL